MEVWPKTIKISTGIRGVVFVVHLVAKHYHHVIRGFDRQGKFTRAKSKRSVTRLYGIGSRLVSVFAVDGINSASLESKS